MKVNCPNPRNCRIKSPGTATKATSDWIESHSGQVVLANPAM
ncbi:MAG: hypothetical protein WCA61_03755 [Nitrososphaeraceae archaeon]